MREAPSLGTAGVEQDGVEKELDRVLGQRSERLRETRGILVKKVREKGVGLSGKLGRQ